MSFSLEIIVDPAINGLKLNRHLFLYCRKILAPQETFLLYEKGDKKMVAHCSISF
jgi:hypothetical protein